MTNEHSERTLTRRATLAGIAGGIGVAIGGGGAVQATGTIDDQYLVDTRSADSEAWRGEVEIVDEVPEIGFASVRGSESALSGLRYGQEIQMEVSPPERPDGAPAADADESVPTISPEATDTATDSTPGPHPLQWDKEAQNVAQLHEQGITGDGTTVAVVDSGVYADHPDLDVNTEASQNFSAADSIGAATDYHGTHVAGIATASGASASGDGSPYVVGIAPDAEVLDMKVFPYLSSASFLNAIRASVDAGADVVNMSFGPGSPYGPSIDSDLSVESYRRIGEYARENGALLVESAGNADANIDAVEETITNSGKGTVPGFLQVSSTGPVSSGTPGTDLPDFGSVAPTHLPAYYTNYGPDSIDVSAPGGNLLASNFDAVLSTMPPDVPGGFARVGQGLYGTLHGTSMAAPNIAGLVALVASENPGATPDQLKQHIKNTAREIDTEYPPVFELFGLKIGYFDEVVPGTFSDFELEDPYTSQRYRGDGHMNATRAAQKSVAFPGGFTIDGETYYPADPDDDGLYEDVNGDGVVDMEDARILYRIAIGSGGLANPDPFDFDGDGEFDINDVQAFIRDLDGL